jgi:outer membrane protein assembly factor BamB
LVIGALATLTVTGAGRPAGAQSPPSPPRNPAGGTGAQSGALDRGVFPFHPLQPLWSKDVAMQPTAPGAIGATRVFIPFSNGKLYALDLVTGDGVLVLDLPTKLAPVIDGPRVVVTGDRVVDAVRAADGAHQWTTPLAAEAAFAPVARGGWVFVALADGSMVSLRSDTGAVVWSAPLGAPTAPPVVEGDRLYAATSGAAVHAVGVLDGKPIWRVQLDGDVTALAAVEGHVFAATSGRWLYALDARRGQIRWRFRIQGSAIGLAADEDRIVAVMLDQTARAFKMGSGAQAWRQGLSYRPAGGPLISGASVLVTGFAPAVLALDRRTGANQGSYAMPLAVDVGRTSLETLVSGPLVRLGATVFEDIVVLITQQGLVHAARRAFEPPPTAVTVMPGTILAVPAPPPGMPAPSSAPPSTPASTPASVPSAGTPTHTPPAPPDR